MAGFFISFEGTEGAGKTTLIQKLQAYLSACGKDVVLTREPGGSGLGKKLRAIILNAEEKISSGAELFLFLADRAEHVEEVIKPALEQGKIVLCDRFADSTAAYQGYGRGMDKALLETLNGVATGGLLPDLTIVLDLEPEIGLSRAKRRNAEQNLTVEEGRFEAEALAFHQKIRRGFLELAKSDSRFLVVDAMQDADTVFEQVRQKIADLLKTENIR